MSNLIKKTCAGLSLLVVTLILFAPQAYALTLPPFSSCLNPQGSLRASYNSGTHGIVGDASTHTGQDAVYIVDQENFLQCFCDDNGKGIQTKWLKASSFSDTDLKYLQSQGWIKVDDGAQWGLLSGAYLAKNDPFVCGGNRSAGEVLGLATTGDMSLIVGIFAFGLLTLASGQLLIKFRS